MPIAAVCGCGKRYSLKDEFAGKSIKCPSCGQAFLVPETSRFAQADPIFDRDKFLIRQKRIAISSKYFVGDENGNEIAFVHRPAGIGRVILLAVAIVIWMLVVGAIIAAMKPENDGGAAAAGALATILLIGGIVRIARSMTLSQRSRGLRPAHK